MIKNLLKLKKFEPETQDLLAEITHGLKQPQKQLPSKLFYDKKGSSLFDQICGLDEYYLTRTEIAIMNDNIEEIADALGEHCLLIELGSGSSKKIRLLLENLEHPAGYVPIDISEEHLLTSIEILAGDYPGLRILPVCADYTNSFTLPLFNFPFSNKVVYYPGSTIGNFTPKEAGLFLNGISRLTGPGSGLLIGVDLVKDTAVLNKAYNDEAGVTAEFNLNILRRLNREIDSDFNLNDWNHLAFFRAGESRIEMHLESKRDQLIHLNGDRIPVSKGETILTEYSYKYTLEAFKSLVSDSYRVETVWTDRDNLFSIQYLVAY
jgi:dimethylhistidine N-methyltransferase